MLIGCLRVGLLTAFPHGANVAVWHGSVESYSVVIHRLQEVQTLPVEVPHPPMPEDGGSRRLHCELRRAAPTDKVQRKSYRSFSSSWSGSVKLFASSLGLYLSKMETAPLRDACLTEKRFRSKPGTINTDIWIRPCTPWASMM